MLCRKIRGDCRQIISQVLLDFLAQSTDQISWGGLEKLWCVILEVSYQQTNDNVLDSLMDRKRLTYVSDHYNTLKSGRGLEFLQSGSSSTCSRLLRLIQ